MGTSARDQQHQIEVLTDPFARNSLRLAYHFRKYALLYVCGVLGAVALAVFPVVSGSGSGGQAASSGASVAAGAGPAGGSVPAGSNGATPGAGSSGASALSGSGAVSGAGGLGSTGAASGAAATGGGGAGSSGAVTGAGGTTAAAPVQSGAGVTVAGVACKPGVRQIPFSAYADQCVAKFSGSNGGATARGVTSNTITIAVRETTDAQGANALASQAEGEAAGGVSNATNYSYVQTLVKWMNSQFELYGRQVKLDLFQGQGNETNEELGQGQAQACADADTEANSLHAFGGINYLGIFETEPFSACAARYQVYIPEGAAYYPESFYQSWSPYVWGITMNCTLISDEVGQWIGQQLAPYPTKWAGNDGVVNLNGRQRKFGTYVPNNQGYQECVQASLNIEENQYHVSPSRENQYNYALDISTFPQDAQKAIIQFAAADDTTVVLACDPISPIFLTQDAVQQNYYPEWAIIGVAGTDTDNYAQLWDQQAITGHLFGLSQLAATQQILNPNGEAGLATKAAGIPLNISSATDYFELLSMFNQLQAAGPDLTAANIAAGTPHIPPGTGAFGTWQFGFDGNTYTAIIDSREVYWDASGTSPADGKAGTYVQIYGGQRFKLGSFPSGEPPYYS